MKSADIKQQEREREKQRIDKLLSTGVITPEEHRQLLASLESPVIRSRPWYQWITSPFQSLTVVQSLAIGLGATVVLTTLATTLNVYFPGALDFQINLKLDRVFPFWQLLLQNLVNIFIPATVFFWGALLARQKNLRWIDFAASMSMVRVSLLMFALCLYILKPFMPDLIPTSELAVISNPGLTPARFVMAILAVLFLAWEVTLFFTAVKDSSGLRDKKLGFVFVAGLMVSEIICYVLNMYIV